MSKKYKYILIGVILVSGFFVSDAFAQTEPYKYKSKEYYKVTSTDPAKDTGNEVCKSVGKTCVGYTALTTDVCKYFNPSAATKADANGSKAGFYCNGAPQGGVCGNENNTCHICPNCNVNADCSTEIGGLYREMYVECAGPEGASDVIDPGKSPWWARFLGQLKKLFRDFSGILKVKKQVTIQVQGPNGITSSAQIPSDSVACEFYQTNKKLVSCGANKAADTFCVQAMGSRFAKAALCEDSGVVICTNPCNPPEKQVPLKQCAFDNARPRGSQAPPLDFCDQTMKVKVDLQLAPGTKKAGQECAHGGECATGICLGQPSDQGIKYFCSCKQTAIDTSCGK